MAYQNNLRIRDSEQIVVGTNVLERNPAYNYGTSLNCTNALVFETCKDCTLHGLHIYNVYGVDAAFSLSKCSRFNISGLTILDCDGIGLLWKDVTNSRVSGCLIRNDTETKAKGVSLKVVGGSGNRFEDNSLGNGSEFPKE